MTEEGAMPMEETIKKDARTRKEGTLTLVL